MQNFHVPGTQKQALESLVNALKGLLPRVKLVTSFWKTLYMFILALTLETEYRFRD